MKRLIYIIFILLLINPIFAQDWIFENKEGEIPDFVENRLQIEFHSVTGTDEVVLDLPKYFGKNVNFVYAPTEHVAITIEPITQIATLKPKDPAWRGSETIVFATSEEYLEEEKDSVFLLPRLNVTKVKINLSEEDIASLGDAFTQQQFNTIIDNLTSEQIEMLTMKTKDALSIYINEELYLNITLNGSRPNYDMSWKIKKTDDMKLATYDEKSDILVFTLILFIIFAVITLSLYLYYGFGDYIKQVSIVPHTNKNKTVKNKIKKYGSKTYSQLDQIERKLAEKSPKKAYKQAIKVMNKFLSKALGVRNTKNLENKLKKKNVPQSVISNIDSFFLNAKNKIYTKNKLTGKEVSSFINSLKDIIRRL